MANAYELGAEVLADHEGEEITVGEIIRIESGPRQAALEALVARGTFPRLTNVDEAEEIAALFCSTEGLDSSIAPIDRSDFV